MGRVFVAMIKISKEGRGEEANLREGIHFDWQFQVFYSILVCVGGSGRPEKFRSWQPESTHIYTIHTPTPMAGAGGGGENRERSGGDPTLPLSLFFLLFICITSGHQAVRCFREVFLP